jgi:hypothetical protein
LRLAESIGGEIEALAEVCEKLERRESELGEERGIVLENELFRSVGVR